MTDVAMNAERLFALYDQVAEAPDAIARLRRFVLDLAVRGKLVEQDPADEPASELLKRIAAEKERLVKAGEMRKPKALPGNNPELWPFSLPNGWTWARLDELSPRSLTDGDWIETKDQSEDGGIRLIQLADVGIGAFLNKSSRFITAETEVRLKCTRLAVGDVLIARLPNPIGRACILPDIEQPAITAVDVAILRTDENMSAEYVVSAMNAPPTRDQIEAYGKGATRFRVATGHLKTVLISLPPLAEQRRIVAKVEELTALLDRLEVTRTAREATRDRLTAASLARLTAPDAQPEDLQTHARFALDALPALTTRPDQIKQLRQTILNLAVRGKLVAQDPADEPASELLKRITTECAQLIKDGKISKQKPCSPLDESETPYAVPNGWMWCRLGSLVLSSDAGWSPRTESHAREGDAWGVLKVSAVSWDHFDPEANKQMLPGTQPRLQAQVHEGDFLISRANTADLIARAVLVHEEPRDLMMSDKIVRLRLSSECSHRFAWLVNNYADYARAYYAANATGVSPSMKNVSRAVILNLPIPLPPLAEQQRIVTKVDAIMALCDRLEAALTTADDTRGRLLDALLHEALALAANELEAA